MAIERDPTSSTLRGGLLVTVLCQGAAERSHQGSRALRSVTIRVAGPAPAFSQGYCSMRKVQGRGREEFAARADEDPSFLR
jgi:hypothetical protein